MGALYVKSRKETTDALTLLKGMIEEATKMMDTFRRDIQGQINQLVEVVNTLATSIITSSLTTSRKYPGTNNQETTLVSPYGNAKTKISATLLQKETSPYKLIGIVPDRS